MRPRAAATGRRPATMAALAILALLAPPGLTRAATGGPDTFGYTWRDDAEPGVTFAWEDISATGMDVTGLPANQDDGNTGFLPLSFSMPYYGMTFNQAAMCTNGWVSLLDATSGSLGNGALPAAAAPIAPIAAFWDDLNPRDAGRMLFQDFGDRAVFTWENVPHFGAAGTSNTFQVILHQDGRIVVQHQQLDAPLDEATLGIESPDESDGLTVYNNDPAWPPPPHAVEFAPPVPVPNLLDCGTATAVSCGERIVADLATGVANQDGYLCSRNDYSGREHVYVLDLVVPTDVRLLLDAISGSPDLIVLDGCDPNRCVRAPTNTLELTGAVGTLVLVVDAPPGEEGAYQLRVECDPLPVDVACAGATPLACGEWVTGDTSLGAANQDAYWCSLRDFGGREDVYVVDMVAPTDFRVILDVQSGNPELIVLNGCNPSDCVQPPGTEVTVNAAIGVYFIVIDSPPGEEGAYRLRFDCNPQAPDLDCAGAMPLTCDDVVTADLSTGTAGQDGYWCTTEDLSGAEHVYVLDVVAPVDLRIDLTTITGDARLLLLDACDPSACLAPPGDVAAIDDALGLYFVVVDSPPGQEGEYELRVSCLADSLAFCGGGLLETDPWNNGNGSWLVEGWLYHPADTHNFALRVDGGAQTYTQDGACTPFPFVTTGVTPPAGPALVTWGAPEGRVDMTMSPTSSGGCCGLRVDIEVTNTDVVEHSYDFRVYHDTAFGDGTGICTMGVVDGGPITVMGLEYRDEVELLPLGADTCEGQVMMASAEEPGVTLASYEMLPPNLPTDMEFLDWNDGGAPCATWTDLVDGEGVGDCGEDSSLLFIWRFPQAAGTLAPGESALASYRIGWMCAFPCDVPCEDPVLTTGQAVDVGPCNDGIRLDWAAAAFPGAGNGVYHVYRSTMSFADALAQPPITPGAGVTDTSFTDATTAPLTSYYYVVRAESTDFPGCGPGPLVNGSIDDIQLGPVLDDADTVAPAAGIGNTLRATGHTDVSIDLAWPLAPALPPEEQHLVTRSDDDPRGPFVSLATTAATAHTDPDAPPRYRPTHVWFYDVLVVDQCGNRSPN